MSKTQFAIFNLDGTVFNDIWRRSYVAAGIASLQDYHHRCHFDKPVEGIKARFSDLRRQGVKLVFMTGRPLKYWDQTRDSIKEHFGYDMVTDYELFMRPVQGTEAEMSDVELKKIIVRSIRTRPDSEVFAVYDHDPKVITMARNEGVFASVIDAEEGDVNYLTETVKPSGEAANAFLVEAEDFAVKATAARLGSALQGVATGYFTVPREALAVQKIVRYDSPFEELGLYQPTIIPTGKVVIDAKQTTLEEIRAKGLETLKQQTLDSIKKTGDEQPLTEVEAQWLADAQAAHIAERALNHHGRTAGENRAAEEEARQRQEQFDKRFSSHVHISTGELLDDLARTTGVTPEEFRKNYEQFVSNQAALTAQEAACDAAQAFFKDTPQASNSVRLGDVMSDLKGVREMSAEMSELFGFFFPNGVVMRSPEDYQFTSVLMTVFYALSRFVNGGMNNATDLQATVLHLAALEPLIRNHTVAALDDGDHAG